jgi:tetratricopeptide (TPR) repeat protein
MYHFLRVPLEVTAQPVLFPASLHLPLPPLFALVATNGGTGSLVEDERCGLTEQRAKISLFGSFHVEGPDGRNITPKSRKAQALLALLALAERGERTRVWLCDRLWSDKDSELAFASLRQCLMDIRRSFGDICNDILHIGQFSIRLESLAVEVDAFAMRAAWAMKDLGHPALKLRGELLEGIDVGDPEFEDWLSLERSRWQDLIEQIEDGLQKPPAAVRGAGDALPERPASGLELLRPGISILPPMAQAGQPLAQHLAEELTELFIRNIIDIESIDVVDAREYGIPLPGPGASYRRISTPLVFQARVRATGTEFGAELKITNAQTSRIEWIATLPISGDPARLKDNPQILSQINFATDAIQTIYRRLMTLTLANPDSMAQFLTLAAVDDMYDLSRERHEQAEARLRKAIDIAPTAQAHAWLSYLQTFKVGQCFAPRSPEIRLEAEQAYRRAMELDPNNSLSLTVCSHVNLFILNNRDRAEDLVQRALAINPNRPMSWDIYSVMYAYNGQPEIGLKYVEWASSISEYGPYTFFLDTGKCMNHTPTGNFEEAVKHGSKALKARPTFLPALRYTAISLGNLGRTEEAQELGAEMRQIDRNISGDAIVKSEFLNLTENQREILRTGLRNSGID